MDCGSDQMNPFLHDPLPSSPSSKALESLFAAAGGDSSPSFHEPSMANFRAGIPGRNARRRRSDEDEAAADDDEEAEVEELGITYRQPGKKRRLAPGQVQYLERSFEMENKLEPERKNQLAKELGLQPRQVAIWFQNRRARFKTKQLERDYDSLKSSFDSLKSDFEHLLMEKEKLKNEVCLLKTKLKQRERGDSNALIERPEVMAAAVEEAGVTLLPCKQEEASSAKSDLSDSESPHCPETDHSTSRAYEAERSDFTQEEGEDLTGSFLPVADYGFGKAEEGDFQGGSCGSLGLPGLEGQPSYWPWLY